MRIVIVADVGVGFISLFGFGVWAVTEGRMMTESLYFSCRNTYDGDYT